MSLIVSIHQAGRSCKSRIKLNLTVAGLIALSVGFSTVIFSAARHILLEGVKFPTADSLVLIWEEDRISTGSEAPGLVRIPTYLTIKENSESLVDACIVNAQPAVLTEFGAPRVVNVGRICANFFQLFGTELILGREFRESEQYAGSADVVIVGEDFWRTTLNSGTDVLGSRILLNERPVTIVGVVPNSFRYPPYPNPYFGPGLSQSQFWRPIVLDRPNVNVQLSNFNHSLIGRLQPTATLDTLRSELELLTNHLDNTFPQEYSETSFRSNRLLTEVRRLYEVPLIAFGTAVIVFLGIASLNIATLLVAQYWARQSEIVTRYLLGATVTTVLSQLLFEFLIIASGGAVIGWTIATQVLLGLKKFSPNDLQLLQSTSVDWTSFLLSFVIIVTCCLIFALIPCIRATRITSQHMGLNRAHTQAATGSTAGRTVMTVIAGVQVVFAVTTLFIATLLVSSFIRLDSENAGFSTEGVLTVKFTTTPVGFPAEARLQFYDNALRVVEQIRGVQHVGLINKLPLDGVAFISTTNKYGGLDSDEVTAEWRWVRGSYFDAMGILTERGRVFQDLDFASNRKLAVVSDVLAEELWGGENPIGKSLRRTSTSDYITVIGVVRGVRSRSVDRQAIPQVYVCDEAFREMSMVIHSFEGIDSLVGPLRSRLEAMNAHVAVSDIRPMQDIVDLSLDRHRFSIFLGILIAGISVLLALFGVASVLAYSIGQQSHAIGVRLVLGATPGEIVWSFVRISLLVVTVGVVAGISFASMLVEVVSSYLYKTSSWDPVSVVFVVVTMLVTGLGVSTAVSIRASTSDPSRMLSS